MKRPVERGNKSPIKKRQIMRESLKSAMGAARNAVEARGDRVRFCWSSKCLSHGNAADMAQWRLASANMVMGQESHTLR